MTYDRLIDRLAADLKPVRPRRARFDALLIAGICLAEIVLFLIFGAARPDMPMAMARTAILWRLSGLGAISLAAGAAAIRSFNPTYSPKPELRWLAVIIALCLASGLGFSVLHDSAATIAARLNWTNGAQCAGKIALLSILPLIGYGALMRRGAATDARRTALLAGVAAAAWGAFVFVFACPFNDPLYIIVWYSIGCGIVALASRLILPRLTRW